MLSLQFSLPGTGGMLSIKACLTEEDVALFGSKAVSILIILSFCPVVDWTSPDTTPNITETSTHELFLRP